MQGDREIWDDFKKGSNIALSKIYYQNVDLLFRYGSKFTKDKDLIKDSIQDSFFDIIKYRTQLKSTDNIFFYLIKTFRNRLFINIKKINNFYFIGTEIHSEIVYSIEEILISREQTTIRKKKIQQALKEISPRQREIIFYRFICNFTYDQICEIMSVKYDSARKQIYRAIKALKDSLQEEE